MDTTEFFDLILPASGHRVISYKGDGGFQNSFGKSNDWATKAAGVIDGRARDTYFACATYREVGSRKGENVEAVRSFWADVDCGPGKPYALVSDGAKAVLDFARTIGLPTPYLIASGGGVHAYWPMDADMDPETWRSVAVLLKAATKKAEFYVDQSRQADIASVLRPVGTRNFKRSEPKTVKLALTGEIGSLTSFRAALVNYLGGDLDAELVLAGKPTTVFGVGMNDDLISGIEFPRAHAGLIADKCAVMELIRSTGGNVDQPTWFHGLGVLAFTVEGETVCHEWSMGHPDYTYAETATKVAQVLRFAPTTCSKFSDHQPLLCQQCPHFGKIKTPMVLGYKDEPLPVSEPVEVIDTARPDLPPRMIYMPETYRMSQGLLGTNLVQDVKVEDDLVPIEFCQSAFYAIQRIRKDDTYHIEWEMVLPKGETRRFLMDNSLAGRAGSELLAFLARYEIVPLSKKVSHIMEEYVRRWVTKLKAEAEESQANQSFGWTDKNEFVLADSVLAPGGGVKRAVLDKMAKSLSPYMLGRGSLETWKNVINTAYNYPGQEQYQFLVACGFAAPLLSMMKQVNGVTVYAHSEGSGVGKTTAQRAGLSAWGNWDELQLADNKATPNYLWRAIGTYHSLPVVFDELTNIDNKVASDLVFSVSSGRPKQRLRADGSAQDGGQSWCTILMASGNNLLSEKLSLHRANAEAEISRLFEFTMVPTSQLSPNDAVDLFPRLLDNYGHAGPLFARYVVDHYDQVQQRLMDTQKLINEEAGIKQSERYWSNLIAATLVSVAICNKLDLLRFDPMTLKAWIIQKLRENRMGRNEYASDPLELFGKMLADLWEGILITVGEGDVRKNAPAQLIPGHKPRGQLVGRAILLTAPNARNEKPVLLLNAAAIRDWCNKKGVSAREMFNATVKAGWAEKDPVKYSLGRGTSEYTNVTSHVACWQLDPDKIAGSLPGAQVSALVSVISGGKNVSGSGTV